MKLEKLVRFEIPAKQEVNLNTHRTDNKAHMRIRLFSESTLCRSWQSSARLAFSATKLSAVRGASPFGCFLFVSLPVMLTVMLEVCRRSLNRPALSLFCSKESAVLGLLIVADAILAPKFGRPIISYVDYLP